MGRNALIVENKGTKPNNNQVRSKSGMNPMKDRSTQRKEKKNKIKG